jgi:hypothetical protein
MQFLNIPLEVGDSGGIIDFESVVRVINLRKRKQDVVARANKDIEVLTEMEEQRVLRDVGDVGG